jgi:RNA polymerase sigma-70 factor (ECF subfamily)
MLTTARNLALNHIALAQNRLVEGVDSFEDSAVALYREESTESVLETEERFLMLCRAVRVLPAQCRRAFVLMKVYGLSRKEVASYMGISENTVHKHVTKGLMMCAEYLEEQESPVRSQGAARPTPAAQKQRSSR